MIVIKKGEKPVSMWTKEYEKLWFTVMLCIMMDGIKLSSYIVH